MSASAAFHDMTNAYSPRLLSLTSAEATKQGWQLNTGVYVRRPSGPATRHGRDPCLRTLGADLVACLLCMRSSLARHMGIEVLGLSLVTTWAAGVLDQAIDHKEVMEIGRRVEAQFNLTRYRDRPQIAVLPASLPDPPCGRITNQCQRYRSSLGSAKPCASTCRLAVLRFSQSSNPHSSEPLRNQPT